VTDALSGKDSLDLSVVLVTYRAEELFQLCVRSLDDAIRAFDGTSELIIVDNGSQGAVDRAVSGQLSRARRVSIPENVGYTEAVMRGIEQARGRWIATINDDVTLDVHALTAMFAAGESDHRVGSVAAQLRFAPPRAGIVNSAGLEIDWLGIAYDRYVGEPIVASEAECVEVAGASGAVALLRREMLEELGGFDVSFFGYLEDVDLAWRARMAGWRALYEPAAVGYHHHSATFGHGSATKYFLVGRNRVRLLAKNATTRQLLKYGPWMLAYDIAYVGFVGTRRRTLAPLRGRLAGIRDWRTYRRAGAHARRPVKLAPVAGLSSALSRDRAWRTA